MGPKILGSLFALFGAACWLVGIYSYVATRDFTAHAVAVDGTVIELQVQRSSRGITYLPVVEYLDAAGKRHTLYSSVSSNPPAFLVDQKVRVLYRPDDPEFPSHARIEGAGPLWGVSFFMGVFGSIFFLVGMVVLLLAWKGLGPAFGKQWTYSKEIGFGGKGDREP